jgi:hypothetical protein
METEAKKEAQKEARLVLRLAQYLLEKGFPSRSKSAGEKAKRAYALCEHVRLRFKDGRASDEEVAMVTKYMGGSSVFESRATFEGEAMHRHFSDVCYNMLPQDVRVRRHRGCG